MAIPFRRRLILIRAGSVIFVAELVLVAQVPRRHRTSVANPKFAIPWSNSPSEFRIQSHASNLLILVRFSNLKFLNAGAMLIPGNFKFTALAEETRTGVSEAHA